MSGESMNPFDMRSDADIDQSDPEVAKQFREIFPQFELLKFSARRTFTANGPGRYHWIEFVGLIDDLLSSGLITPSMLPVKPKLKADNAGARDSRERWWVKSVKGKRVRVYFTLNEDFDRTHPLAHFAVWNWQTAEPVAEKLEEPESTQTAAEWKDQRLDWFKFDLAYCASRHWKGHESCFRFADTDSKRMESMIRKFSNELLDVMARCQVIDARRPQLRLVVDNDAKAAQ